MHHDDAFYDAANRAREELTRNTKEAAKMQRLLTSFGVDLKDKKIVGIKTLRETLGIGLKEAKDAWELAYELRAA
jgi:ribosomal protein L7/L12